MMPAPDTSLALNKQSILFPSPTSLLHPALLEKMRVGSPSSAHMLLSTLNRQQSEKEIRDTLYELQKVAPFPNLPPYFIHKSEFSGQEGGYDDGVTGQLGASDILLASHMKTLPSGSFTEHSHKSTGPSEDCSNSLLVYSSMVPCVLAYI